MKTIYMLIHPLFVAIKEDYSFLHPINLRLLSTWKTEIGKMISDPEAMLVYCSPIALIDVEYTGSGNSTYDSQPRKVYKTFEEILLSSVPPDRLVTFNGWYPPSKDEVLSEFKKKSIVFDTHDTFILPMGEVRELCVHTWSKCLAKDLGIDLHNIIPMPNATLSTELASKITAEVSHHAEISNDRNENVSLR